MRASTFMGNWKTGKAAIKYFDRGTYEEIEETIEGKTFEVGRFSRYEAHFDEEKNDKYLIIPTKEFSARTPFFAHHTFITGVGIVVTFRGNPAFVLDPGRNWRSYVAAHFGVTPTRYAEAARQSRLIERLVDAGVQGERTKRVSAETRLTAATEEASDLRIELSVAEQEIRHLRKQVSRLGPE